MPGVVAFTAFPCSLIAAERMSGVASTSAPSGPVLFKQKNQYGNAFPRGIPLLPRRHRSLNRGSVCRSLDDDDDKPQNDAFKNIRKWLGQRTSLVPNPNEDPSKRRMDINPGQSVMDLEDYFASGGASGQQSYSPPPPVPSPGASGRQEGTSDIRPPGSAPLFTASTTPPSLSDWSGGIKEDWDGWEGTPAIADLDDNVEAAELREQVIERRRARRGRRTKVRDEYLRPIVDVTGIYNRLAIGEREAEERVFVEAITNQYESREALRYAAVLVGVPFTVAFLVSNLIARPVWGYAEQLNPAAFALSDRQKVEGAEAMHREEVRMRLEASIGQAPALSDEAMLEHLHNEAIHFADHMKQYNRQAMLNAVSDSMAGAALFILLLQDNSQRSILFRTIGRVFAGLSDTAKAFIIILVTDILLGYHSEEGWTAGLHLLSHHYGMESDTNLLHIFVATVPVLLDSLFKYWIFVELNKVDPAAAVTLRQMDRH